MAKIIPMKVADVRAAFARKFDEMRARNWKRSKNERKPAPEPANYPFWLRVVVVIALALLAVNVFFFLGPATGVHRLGGGPRIHQRKRNDRWPWNAGGVVCWRVVCI